MSQFQIRFHPKAVRELSKIDRIWQTRIKQKIELLSSDPNRIKSGIKTLKGRYQGLARLRVGIYRVIFRVIDEELVILIVQPILKQ